jgi:PLP dependent protein
VSAAYDAGQRVFGENRVQEGTAKIASLREAMPGATWHLIGHLQANKARLACESFSIIESVDSVRLARRLNTCAEQRGQVLPVLLEVNVAREESKSGFDPDEVDAAGEIIATMPFLEMRGLMTVAPLAPAEAVRPAFTSLRQLRDEMRAQHDLEAFTHLSMGMSNDYEVAIEEGATMVRLGRAIFGSRPTAGK